METQQLPGELGSGNPLIASAFACRWIMTDSDEHEEPNRLINTVDHYWNLDQEWFGI